MPQLLSDKDQRERGDVAVRDCRIITWKMEIYSVFIAKYFSYCYSLVMISCWSSGHNLEVIFVIIILNIGMRKLSITYGKIESSCHYLLHCSNYITERLTLDTISNTDAFGYNRMIHIFYFLVAVYLIVLIT